MAVVTSRKTFSSQGKRGICPIEKNKVIGIFMVRLTSITPIDK